MVREKYRSRSIRKQLPAVILYKEDIVMLFKILKEAGFENYTRIDSREFEFENEKDLIDSEKEPSNLEIVSYKPFTLNIKIDSLFSNQSVEIDIDNNSIVGAGLAAKLETFLLSKKRKIPVLLQKHIFWFRLIQFLMYYCAIFLIFANILIKIDPIKSFSIVEYAKIALVFAFLISLKLSPETENIKSKIILKPKNSVSNSWWQRNRDQIYVSLTTGIFVSVVGGIIVYFLTGF